MLRKIWLVNLWFSVSYKYSIWVILDFRHNSDMRSSIGSPEKIIIKSNLYMHRLSWPKSSSEGRMTIYVINNFSVKVILRLDHNKGWKSGWGVSIIQIHPKCLKFNNTFTRKINTKEHRFHIWVYPLPYLSKWPAQANRNHIHAGKSYTFIKNKFKQNSNCRKI